ncbi:hypothetical protein DCAR_0208187 [Daucus carota subsp. sativus]|uniref:Uncharacterized protein n=1 Tax=Daucus carota subsp. sativus TaxID=79200 RepID=A0A166EDE2_DAUCS|nr:PREDICTED: pentatricopeptide repeat-containing protein At1g08070, chloroplastic-like [Daucus carota subsp. sativus]WOG88952.1 hypothetical protein DCAR_0208187 [Daucus carota subsp. sativus]
MSYARQLFDQMPAPSSALWNTMFKGYVQNDMYGEVLGFFNQMNRVNAKHTCFTFPMVLKSCAKLLALREGRQVHCFVLKIGFGMNSYVGTTLVDMYSSGGEIGLAYKAFSEMVGRNVVAWTSMVNAFLLYGDIVSARRLFDLAPDRDIVLWNTMVSGYIKCGDMVAARELFDLMPNKDLMSWNTLLNGYANNADVQGTEKLFEEMPEKNVFSWNGLIGSYAHNGRLTEVLGAFKRMLRESHVSPNDATLVIVLSACSRLGALDMGKWVHAYVESSEYKENVYVGNGLIDMYAKCGMIESAVNVFRKMSTKDLVSYNTLINGLAVHGHGADALGYFDEMENAGVRPDGITFVGILCACSHLGEVEIGLHYYHLMINRYSVLPQIEHCGCMVDLLGRAGLLEQAVNFIINMPLQADSVVWTALLGACRIYKNVELAELALEQLIEIEPENPSNYVMLANVYSDARRWEDVARSKIAMRNTKHKKVPGCSLIELDQEVVEFYSYDERHPKTEELYEALRGLMKQLKSCGYVPKDNTLWEEPNEGMMLLASH